MAAIYTASPIWPTIAMSIIPKRGVVILAIIEGIAIFRMLFNAVLSGCYFFFTDARYMNAMMAA